MVRAHAEMGPMYVSPVRIRSWMPHDAEFIGPEQIPVIQPSSWHDLPGRLCAFDKLRAVQNPEDALVHGYRADHVLEPIARRPSSFVNRFSNFAGIITPDFSVYRNMPRCERIYHTRVARGVGAYFQSRGLLIVPNVRWADRSDFDYCFLGLPVNAVVAISAHGCSRTSEDRHHFREGLNALLDVLEPKSVLVHGPMAQALRESAAAIWQATLAASQRSSPPLLADTSAFRALAEAAVSAQSNRPTLRPPRADSSPSRVRAER